MQNIRKYKKKYSINDMLNERYAVILCSYCKTITEDDDEKVINYDSLSADKEYQICGRCGSFTNNERLYISPYASRRS